MLSAVSNALVNTVSHERFFFKFIVTFSFEHTETTQKDVLHHKNLKPQKIKMACLITHISFNFELLLNIILSLTNNY